ncbi:lysophosphatidylcholine acyltransferase 1 isoform X2 [Ixodes scapularis]|uniref:lysophosphatidylcholine acyltransferase 1 isoform X2 n=1 Tax=Ixodes scapularis TaxID=6945 RepID=UPI001A9CF305|nr:lysophosphatidylcholine acyltransferase 1 isoform X2 [Ixodes scapularis]
MNEADTPLRKRSMNHGGFNASTFPLGDTKILPDYKNLKTLDEIDNMTTSLIDGSHSPAKDAVGNPFYFRIHLSRSDKIKVVLMSVFVVPIRIVLIVIFLFLTWLGCYLGQLGLSPQRLQDQPIMGFRRLLQTLSRELVLMSVRSAGFSMRTVGRHASVQEAPILVAAPHSSFFDTVAAMLGYPLPSAVVRSKSRGLFFLSTILNFTQPVYVKRSDPNSRQNTVHEIARRATSKDPWSQVIIFPEGTCTNRSCLITFKLGAFVPGVPIQPIIIRYPNELNTLTWTWDGPTAFQTLWLTLCQLRTNMEIEYMPVYIPSSEEKKDPKLFAENVRRLMAKALQLPVSSYSYDDLKQANIEDDVHERTVTCTRLQRLVKKNRIQFRDFDSEILKLKAAIKMKENLQVTFSEFSNLMGIPSDRFARNFFEVIDIDNTGRMDLRCFLSALWLVHPSEPHRAENAFKAFSGDGGGIILEDFTQLLWILLELPKSAALAMFEKLDRNSSGKVYLDDFREFLCSSTQWEDVFTPSERSQPLEDNVGRAKED